MYYSNLAYKWGVTWPVGEGVCVAAWGVNSAQAFARDTLDPIAEPDSRIFDPQLYLLTLEYPECDRAVRRLSTYPWINPNITPYDEGVSITEWEDQETEQILTEWPYALPQDRAEILERSRRCIEFQIEFGVNSLILPSPLLSDQESDYSYELDWLDAGIEAVPDDCDLPIFATLAISDNCLVHRVPADNELLRSFVDQITARDIDGLYIVLEQSVGGSTTYLRDRNVAWSLLSICHDVGVRSDLQVIINYADAFGLVCLAAGASIFISGPTTRSRRLCLSDYESRGGGGAFPRLHSSSMLIDLLPERDIQNKILPARLIRLISLDRTSYSAPLIDALSAGHPLATIPEWHERVNNRTASDGHYQEVIARKAEESINADDPISSTMAWLQGAESNAGYLATRFEDDPLSFDHRHISSWRSAFEQFLSQYSL